MMVRRKESAKTIRGGPSSSFHRTNFVRAVKTVRGQGQKAGECSGTHGNQQRQSAVFLLLLYGRAALIRSFAGKEIASCFI